MRCKCGITVDDGKPMAECDGGCKTWVHIKCHKLKPGADFYCDKCTEAVHSSKAHPEVGNPMGEPVGQSGVLQGSKGSEAADDDHVDLGAGEGRGPEGAVAPALVSRKTRAASRSPTPDAAATGPVSSSPVKGAEQVRADSTSPGVGAEQASLGVDMEDKENESATVRVSDSNKKKHKKVQHSQSTVYHGHYV